MTDFQRENIAQIYSPRSSITRVRLTVPMPDTAAFVVSILPADTWRKAKGRPNVFLRGTSDVVARFTSGAITYCHSNLTPQLRDFLSLRERIEVRACAKTCSTLVPKTRLQLVFRLGRKRTACRTSRRIETYCAAETQPPCSPNPILSRLLASYRELAESSGRP